MSDGCEPAQPICLSPHFLSLRSQVRIMEGAGIINGNINGQQQQGRGFGPSPASSAVSAGSSHQQRQSFRNDVPVFLDQTFTMIENVPDHIVSWSAGGDTFIVKQVMGDILPAKK